MTPELWSAVGVVLVSNLIGFGALRQAVVDLKETVLEEKRERKALETRVRELEIAHGRARAAGH